MRDAMLGRDARVAETLVVVVTIALLTNRAREIDQDANGMNEGPGHRASSIAGSLPRLPCRHRGSRPAGPRYPSG